jgi:hypothetical protein
MTRLPFEQSSIREGGYEMLHQCDILTQDDKNKLYFYIGTESYMIRRRRVCHGNSATKKRSV